MTAHWDHFEVDDFTDLKDVLTTYGIDENCEKITDSLGKRKIAALKAVTLKFFEKYFPNSVTHLRLDVNGETPHSHGALLVIAETTSKTRGTQRLISRLLLSPLPTTIWHRTWRASISRGSAS